MKEESIQGIQIPDGIAELMLEKMKNLNKGTRDVLMLASCIGNSFDLDTISTVCEKTQIEVENLLLPAVMEGFIYQPSSYNNNGTERYEFSRCGETSCLLFTFS